METQHTNIRVDIDELKSQRTSAGHTQESLAVAAGVSPAAIGMIESGRRQPSALLLVRIAATLGCDADVLTYTQRDAA